MKALALLVLASWCAALAQAPQRSRGVAFPEAHDGKRLALVIGNDAYPDNPLHNAANDARAMKAALEDSGFGVRIRLNTTQRELEMAIGEFVEIVNPGDIAMFFYAGHGMQLSDQNYLIPVDFHARTAVDAKYDAYPAQRIEESLEATGAATRIIVLDACRNNPFRGLRGAGNGLADMEAGKGTYIAFATSPGKTASDAGNGRNGLFTGELAAVLRQPGLTIDDVFNEVRDRVLRESGGQQVPWSSSSLVGGPFYFKPVSGGKVRAEALAKTNSSDLPAKESGPSPDRETIAVLPFENQSSNKDIDFLCDGLWDETVDSLVTVRGLRVTSRPSAYSFKGKNLEPEEIARKLNVTTLLQGSVRNQGNRVRITVAMIRAAGGFEEWSGSFDGQLDDSLDLPKDIAAKVTEALRLKMLGEDHSNAENPEAHAACMKGWYSHHRQDFAQAINYFQSAIKVDPNFAEAWVGLGQSSGSQADSGQVQNTEEAYRKERQFIEKAVRLDPHLPNAYDALGWVSMVRDFDWEDARASFRRALELEPAFPYAIAHLANLDSIEGRSGEAIAGYRRALERDPVNPAAYIDFGKILFYAGRLEEAIKAYQEALKIEPKTLRVHYRIGCVFLTQSKPQEATAEMEQEKHPFWGPFGRVLAYHAVGRQKESDAILADLIAKYPKDAPFQIAEACAFRGEKDQAFQWLDRAYEERDGGLIEIKGDPLLKNLEGDPRYAELLKKMRLPL